MDIQVIASGSTGNSYLINDGETSLLLDAGVSIKALQVACRFKLSSVGGCLISHSHQDHCKAHRELVKLGVNIYLSADTLSELGAKGHRYKAVSPLDQFTIGTMVIKAFDLQHDVANLGYLIASRVTGEKVLYITDTAYCKYTFVGLTHMMIEANYDRGVIKERVARGVLNASLKDRIIQSHMSIDTVLELLRANDLSKLKKVYLMHLSRDNSLADPFKLVVQRATGAEVIVC